MASEVPPVGVSVDSIGPVPIYLPQVFHSSRRVVENLLADEGEKLTRMHRPETVFPGTPCAPLCRSASPHNVTLPDALALPHPFSVLLRKVFPRASFQAGRTQQNISPYRRRRRRISVVHDACEFSVLPELLSRKSFLSHFCPTLVVCSSSPNLFLRPLSFRRKRCGEFKKVVPFLARV